MVATNNARSAPREYKRHQRYSKFAQFRNSRQEKEFLRVQSDRLSTTQAVLFAKLNTYPADQIQAASTLGALA